MAYKLIVSDRLDFEVKFSLKDGSADKHFGLLMTGMRCPREQIEKEHAAGVTIGEFLASREVKLVGWLNGVSPLKDENDEPVAAGAEAYEALCDLVAGIPGLVHLGYLEANGAKGRAGN